MGYGLHHRGRLWGRLRSRGCGLLDDHRLLRDITRIHPVRPNLRRTPCIKGQEPLACDSREPLVMRVHLRNVRKEPLFPGVHPNVKLGLPKKTASTLGVNATPAKTRLKLIQGGLAIIAFPK